MCEVCEKCGSEGKYIIENPLNKAQIRLCADCMYNVFRSVDKWIMEDPEEDGL